MTNEEKFCTLQIIPSRIWNINANVLSWDHLCFFWLSIGLSYAGAMKNLSFYNSAALNHKTVTGWNTVILRSKELLIVGWCAQVKINSNGLGFRWKWIETDQLSLELPFVLQILLKCVQLYYGNTDCWVFTQGYKIGKIFA